jgi:hypothetical protein
VNEKVPVNHETDKLIAVGSNAELQGLKG